jgi:hypothetical protein
MFPLILHSGDITLPTLGVRFEDGGGCIMRLTALAMLAVNLFMGTAAFTQNNNNQGQSNDSQGQDYDHGHVGGSGGGGIVQ